MRNEDRVTKFTGNEYERRKQEKELYRKNNPPPEEGATHDCATRIYCVCVDEDTGFGKMYLGAEHGYVDDILIGCMQPVLYTPTKETGCQFYCVQVDTEDGEPVDSRNLELIVMEDQWVEFVESLYFHIINVEGVGFMACVKAWDASLVKESRVMDDSEMEATQ